VTKRSDVSEAGPRAPASLSEAAALSGLMDNGFLSPEGHPAAEFISRRAQLRFWARRPGTATPPAG
jgi:hypothetical protein